MVTVRRATADDVDAVRAVGHATWPSTYGPIRGEQYVRDGLERWWSAEAVRRGIEGGATTTYVAEDATGTVVACAVVGERDGNPFVWKLYVVPTAQRTGAGRALLDAVIADLPDDAAAVQLDHAEGNDRAHAFYTARGFVETHRHGPEGDREVRMARLLR
ncbi:GNAT family N-acetyltransferase [Jatrophihabitans sp. YIM 134969]